MCSGTCCRSPIHSHWIFKVNIVASEAIKTTSYNVYTGLDKETFEVLNAPNAKKMNEKGAEVLAIEIYS